MMLKRQVLFVSICLRYFHAFSENLVEFCHPTWQIYVRIFLVSWRRSCNAVWCNFLPESVLCTHACTCCKFADIVAYILVPHCEQQHICAWLFLGSCLCFQCEFKVDNALWAYFHVNIGTLTCGFSFLCL